VRRNRPNDTAAASYTSIQPVFIKAFKDIVADAKLTQGIMGTKKLPREG
jgi:hypothetical protein